MKAQSESQVNLMQKQMDELQHEHEETIAQFRKKYGSSLQVSIMHSLYSIYLYENNKSNDC